VSRRKSIWREAFKDVHFLWRKSIFFMVLAVVVFGGLRFFNVNLFKSNTGNNLSSFEVSASLEDNISTNSTGNGGVFKLDIYLASDGTMTVNGKAVEEKVSAQADYDELRYLIMDGSQTDSPNAGFYDRAQIYVHLPNEIEASALPEANRRLIGAHGADTSTVPSRFLDQKTILLTATDIQPTAILTLYLALPQGYLDLGTGGEVNRWMENISGIAWLIISGVMLIITIVILLVLYLKTTGERTDRAVGYMYDRPPNDLPPIVVGVLYNGRIRAKDLMALVVDLARRGFIGIEGKDGELMLYKRQVHDEVLWHTLRTFEQVLLSELFADNKPTLSTADEIKERTGRDLFSQRITKVYAEIYNEVTRHGFFDQNPARVHLKYKIYGMGAFAFSLIGFGYSIFASPDPKFTLFIWAAMVAVSFLGIFFATKISTRTKLGKRHLEDWIGFRNYLILGKKIDYESAIEGKFEQYLPYAIALDSEEEWAWRFSEVDFHLPSWYGASSTILDVQGFTNSFYPLVSKMTEQLSFLKEPVLD